MEKSQKLGRYILYDYVFPQNWADLILELIYPLIKLWDGIWWMYAIL